MARFDLCERLYYVLGSGHLDTNCDTRIPVHNRLRLMMGATALLYLGPLLAGLGGFGWQTVPAFVAIFLLWTLILRPSTWPKTRADWQNPAALTRLLTQSTMQVLLVSICFGIGRGLGGVMATLPPFPVLLPIAISFLAIPLCRLMWDPNKAEATDRFLDTAIAEISATATGVPPQRSDARALTAQLLAPLQALPDATDDAEIARHLRAMAAHVDPSDVAHVLLSSAQSGTAGSIGMRALILHATDLRHSVPLAGLGVQARILPLIAADPDMILMFALRSLAQLRDDAAVWPDCATPTALRARAATAGPDAAAALLALADLTASLSPQKDADGSGQPGA